MFSFLSDLSLTESPYLDFCSESNLPLLLFAVVNVRCYVFLILNVFLEDAIDGARFDLTEEGASSI